MKIHLLLTFVAMALGILPSTAEDTRDEKGRRYFAAYLANCPADQIRCVWHLGGYGAGMVMEIDLKNSTVFTDTKVVNWADQNTGTRKLSRYQIITLKEIMDKMPESTAPDLSLKCVSISFQHEGKVEIRRYFRSNLPRDIQRIYDIGGDYIDFKNPGEQPGAGPPATQPAEKGRAELQPPIPTSKDAPRQQR